MSHRSFYPSIANYPHYIPPAGLPNYRLLVKQTRPQNSEGRAPIPVKASANNSLPHENISPLGPKRLRYYLRESKTSWRFPCDSGIWFG